MYVTQNPDELLEGLNPAQREAASITEGPLLIVAGAGAGKTKTLTHRIGRLVAMGIPGGAILAITFTNKAAKEMRERVFRILDIAPGGHFGMRMDVPFLSTFHALGIAILREKGERVGVARTATILAQDESLKLIKAAMSKAGIDPKEWEPRKIQSLISRHKGAMGTAESIKHTTNNRYLSQILERAFVLYEAELRTVQALDFDDLLVKTVELLERHEDIRTYYQERWRYIHVDEYQDTNEVQYRLVRLLSGTRNNVCVVGDSDQNIYSWRGASIANILNFEKDYPGAQTVLLEQNYRSTETILHAANSIIEKNTMRKPKRLFTENGKGDLISTFAGYDETDEARFVSTRIGGLLAKEVRPSDIAILYRTNFQSRILEESLLYAGIPYQVLGVRFYERKEVKDVISYVKAARNPQSVFDLERVINVPARGVGKVTLGKIMAGERGALPVTMRSKVDKFFELLSRIHEKSLVAKPSELIAYVIKETGIEDMYQGAGGEGEEDSERLANVRELVSVAMRYDVFEGEEGILQFLGDVALESDQDTMKGEVDAVRLMTVHASKGLEFPYVFITGLEQDLFPSRRAQEGGGNVSEREEERRLFYVALTRAAKKVFLTYASFRTIFGNRQLNMPSEFLSDIDDTLTESESRDGSMSPKSTPMGGKRVSLLDWDDEGDTVVYV